MEQSDPNKEIGYSVRLARNFIYLAHKEAELEYSVKAHERSPYEGELGNIPTVWNAGLFRYLDECVSLLNSVEFALLMRQAADNGDASRWALITLFGQIKSNCVAIRVIANHGLDDQARILLRSLFENCTALSRAIIDSEFRANFHAASSPKESNHFWHGYMAKGKTIAYLTRHNEISTKKCPLVMGDLFDNMLTVIGVQAHPNYLYSSFNWSRRWSDQSAQHTIASNHAAASELVLSSVCQLVLTTIVFVGMFGQELGAKAACEIPDAPDSILTRSKTADVVIERVGKIAGIMSLMLMKWVNRQRPDFDPQKHL